LTGANPAPPTPRRDGGLPRGPRAGPDRRQFRNNFIRGCGYRVCFENTVDPGRPHVEGNPIVDCAKGAYVDNSMPFFHDSQMTYCRDCGIYCLGARRKGRGWPALVTAVTAAGAALISA
jgi:hypothetical protein